MWVNDIQTSVFSRIQSRTTAQFKKRFPDIFFTKSARLNKDATFPTIYVKKLQGAERGQTLEGTSINATLSSFQIEVTDNGENDSVANEIAWFICGVMKSMRYQMMGEPITEETDQTFRVIARYQRIVGFNDIL